MGQVLMQARSEEGNVAREYLCILERDLFDHYVLTTSWGRIGGSKQTRTVSFKNELEALRGTKKILQRRATLKKRLGVPYEIIYNSFQED